MSNRQAFALPPEGGDLYSSSTLLDPASSSTLRARLRSPHLVARVDQSSPPTCRPDPDVYQRFRACFALDSMPSVVQQSNNAKSHPDVDGGALAQLRVVCILSKAQEQLGGLQKEWDSCLAEQHQAWTELRKIEDEASQLDESGLDDALTREIKLLSEALDELVQSNEELLDEIDAEFRGLIQGETMTMMQSIMAG
ncbi:hypothetical protein HRG_010866 [Hirsutella rhossiliensis]|uniref:Uncharacterized protein n=1 Tax=Hirsutella rhossiliensis TaxID=111463 RepID=A0A9P8SD28_9HYPO|nr:uncharacterized protein HRG_10866 [Hirsutella rhossiliensis]KAH0958171.1 hypothetical protein HRG_10866 [Hirsutella rhossiliensis]